MRVQQMSETKLDTEPRKAFWRDIVIATLRPPISLDDTIYIADELLEEYDRRCGYLPKEQGEPNDSGDH